MNINGRRIHTMTPEKIRQLRKRLGLSQVEFAKRVGVAGNTVHRWEVGAMTPHQIFQRQIQQIHEREKRRGAA
jgi:DNA-binding transcriptional regulator YiaG